MHAPVLLLIPRSVMTWSFAVDVAGTDMTGVERQRGRPWSAAGLSMCTPKSSTDDESLTRVDDRDRSVVVSLLSCCRVPSHTSCVLSAFILSRLFFIRSSTRSTQATKRWTEMDADDAGALRYTWVSSAYECPVSSALAVTSNNSETGGYPGRSWALWYVPTQPRPRWLLEFGEIQSLFGSGGGVGCGQQTPQLTCYKMCYLISVPYCLKNAFVSTTLCIYN